MNTANPTPAPVPTRSFVAGWRLYVVIFLILGVFGILIFRLFNLQIVEGAEWLARAEDNRTKTINDPAPRGIIYDRNGYILARNTASYNVVITPADLPDDPADIEQVYRTVSELVAVPVNSGTVEEAKNFSACVPGPGIAQLVELGDSLAPYSPVKIKCNIDEELAMAIRQKSVDLPGVSVQIEAVREYPTGETTANIIGFLGPIPANQVAFYQALGLVDGRDKVGYAGIEASMQDVLAGTNGIRVVERDVAGQEIRNMEAPRDPVPGNNVYLTIDARLQQATRAALESEIVGWNNYYYPGTGEQRISSGVAVAINPKTGEILSMVQWPSFENNRFARLIPGYYYNQLSNDPRRPLLNYAISAEYPPGSTFKLTTATGAMNENVVDVNQIIDAPGQITLCERFTPQGPCANERPFVDWIYETNPAGFGKIDFYHCIAWSSNVCFYKLGGGYEDEITQGLGPLRHAEYSRALGYGAVTGIELPGEADGLVPTPQWKRINLGENWSTGDTYIASVGQGYVLATPLQVLLSAATIANRGVQMKPTLIRQVVDSEGNIVEKYFNPEDFSVTDTPRDSDSFQISPFVAKKRWDVTQDNIIKSYVCDEDDYCDWDGVTMKNVTPYTIEQVRTGMRLAAIDARGTLNRDYSFGGYPIAVAGKTGTAEYCDDVAREARRCDYGLWPTHAWTVAFAPFEDPEIAVVVFCYNAGEGGSVAAPIAKLIMDAYFKIKAIDAGQSTGGGG